MDGTFHVLWPWIFILLPLPLLLTLRKQHVESQAIELPPALSTALDSLNAQSTLNHLVGQLVPWLCWLLLLIAIAQPVYTGKATVQTASGRAMAIAIDLSGSMERKDFVLDGLASDRLSVVKRVAGEFISARAGDRLSLVLFAEEAFIASPLSFDVNAVRAYLDSAGIGMAGRSTAIGDALGLAIQTLRDDPAPEKSIVLLSDGTNNSGTVEPEEAAELAKDLSISIHTIAMASEEEASGFATSAAADLDEETLKNIASASNGQFFRARTSEDLTSVYNTVNALRSAETDAPEVVLQHDLRNLALFALFIVLLAWEASRWRHTHAVSPASEGDA